MSVIEIKNDRLSVGINTFGSELTYIKGCNGKDYLWDGDERVWSLRAPVLFPICGGLKESQYTYEGIKYSLPKHGFAEDSEFSGNRISDTCAEFVLTSNEETLKVFPFEFRLKIVFELIENKLRVTNIVENTSEKPMYFSIGAHEGYSCPEGIEEYKIVFDEPETLDSFILDGDLLESNSVRIIENSRELPLKYDFFAVDALVFKNINFNKATLTKKDGTQIVSVEFDKAKYFLLWTKPDAKYICLEPWCGIQDIVGSSFELKEKEGLIALENNSCFTFTHTIECFV